jgi:acetylornithine deacetylase/succinyl-diaminopimelate desuccinylase family protein
MVPTPDVNYAGRGGDLHVTDVIQTLQELIALATPQPPGEVLPVVQYLAHRLERAGATLQYQYVEPDKPNLLATLDFGPGKTLCFNTHTDVNGVTGQAWSSDPWSPLVRDGLVWGRGACDAKGALAAMLCAMERLAANPAGLSGRLVLTAVMGEEAGGIGSLHLVQQGFHADGAVVGEPTQNEVLCAHKGTFMRRVTLHGKGAHSGRPELGVNAISAAATLVAIWDQLHAKLLARPHPLVGPASATVTLIDGGTRQNTIPDRCSLLLDRRLVPGENHDQARTELAVALAEVQARHPSIRIEPPVEVVATVPSETNLSAAIVTAALAARSAVSLREARPGGFSAGCDMSKLVLHAGIPTVICGPGNLSEAHAPDEFVSVQAVQEAEEIYCRIATRFLTH